MKIIGLCGGSGAGKGEVCRLFEKYGIPSVDTDAVSRIVMKKGQKCYDEVTANFGSEIIDENGEIIRRKLAEVIYADAVKKRVLEGITHRHIIEYSMRLFDEFEKKGFEFAIADAPLLFESGMDKICFKTVAVIADEENRVRRITARDNISREFALNRIRVQISDDELKKKCDYIIYNNSDFETLEKNVRMTADEIKK